MNNKRWVAATIGVLVAAYGPIVSLAFCFWSALAIQSSQFSLPRFGAVFELFFLLWLIVTALMLFFGSFLVGGFCASWWWNRQKISWEIQEKLLLVASLTLFLPLGLILIVTTRSDFWLGGPLAGLFLIRAHFGLLVSGADLRKRQKLRRYLRYFLGQTPYKPGEELPEN